MNERSRHILGACVKSALLIIGTVGQVNGMLSNGFMRAAHFLYFTNLSNLWIMACAAAFLVYDLLYISRGEAAPRPGKALYAVKFSFTAAIMLTFTVFSLLLTPEMIANGNTAYLTGLNNLCVHNLVPLLALADWFLSDREEYRRAGKSFFLFGGVMPIAYCIFVMLGSLCGVTYGGAARFPYFFFNYDINGWFTLGGGRLGVFYWIILISAGQLALSALVVFIKNKLITKDITARCERKPEAITK